MSVIWRHVTNTIQFSLVVYVCGVKCGDQEHAQRLIDALESDYTARPLNANLFKGCPSQVSVPGSQTSVICPTQVDSPGLWPTHQVCPSYRYITSDNPQDITRAHVIVGTLFYNAHAVKPFLKWPTNKIPQSSKLTSPLKMESSITQSKKALQIHRHESLLDQDKV
jgi:hypothetical protein